MSAAGIEREALPGARGALRGLAATVSGVRFVVFRPRSWPKAAIPAAVASTLFLLGSGGLAWAAWSATAAQREGVPGYILSVALVLVSLALAAVLALSLAQPLSGFALEAISRDREVTMGGLARTEEGTVWTVAWRSLRVTTAGLAVSLPVLVALALLSALVPVVAVVTVPLKFVVSALLVAWDLLDYPFALRGLGVRQRLAWMRGNLGAVLLFGASTGALLLVPVLGLFMLPCGVAAATELVVRVERGATPA